MAHGWPCGPVSVTCLVAMGMLVTHGFAHDFAQFDVAGGWALPQLVHGVRFVSGDGFEGISHVPAELVNDHGLE